MYLCMLNAEWTAVVLFEAYGMERKEKAEISSMVVVATCVFTNVKGSINFPIAFVVQKPTVKIIGFVGVMLVSLIGFQFDQANSHIARINLLHS